jgi:hypothetical protein
MLGGDPARIFDFVPLAALRADSLDLTTRLGNKARTDLTLCAHDFGHGYSAKKGEERRMGPTLFGKNL